MISDAGHSFSDLISDGLTLLALRMSALPPDVDHPYGPSGARCPRAELIAPLARAARRPAL
jgi:divalent metal cation (Fe/Co/Zn/Cd) transporter